MVRLPFQLFLLNAHFSLDIFRTYHYFLEVKSKEGAHECDISEFARSCQLECSMFVYYGTFVTQNITQSQLDTAYQKFISDIEKQSK